MHHRGVVATFDEHRGRGEIESDDGSRYPFHCTAIADGTRTIPVGVTVEFRVDAGPLGLVEASSVRRL
jgi:cold shock CspA family protein